MKTNLSSALFLCHFVPPSSFTSFNQPFSLSCLCFVFVITQKDFKKKWVDCVKCFSFCLILRENVRAGCCCLTPSSQPPSRFLSGCETQHPALTSSASLGLLPAPHISALTCRDPESNLSSLCHFLKPKPDLSLMFHYLHSSPQPCALTSSSVLSGLFIHLYHLPLSLSLSHTHTHVQTLSCIVVWAKVEMGQTRKQRSQACSTSVNLPSLFIVPELIQNSSF